MPRNETKMLTTDGLTTQRFATVEITGKIRREVNSATNSGSTSTGERFGGNFDYVSKLAYYIGVLAGIAIAD